MQIELESNDSGTTLAETLSKIPAKLCTVKLSKGKRKGLNCNRKLNSTIDEEFCKFHVAKSATSELCPVILTKGERKNQMCNRKVMTNSDGSSEKLCKIHKTIEIKRPYNPYEDKEGKVDKADIVNGEIKSLICNLKLSKLDVELVKNARGMLI